MTNIGQNVYHTEELKVAGSHLDLLSQKLLIPGNLHFNTFSGKTKAHL